MAPFLLDAVEGALAHLLEVAEPHAQGPAGAGERGRFAPRRRRGAARHRTLRLKDRRPIRRRLAPGCRTGWRGGDAPGRNGTRIYPRIAGILSHRVWVRGRVRVIDLCSRRPQGLGVGRFPFLLGPQLGQVGGGEAPVVLGGPGLGEGVVVAERIGGCVVFDREAAAGEVDVQRPHLQPEAAGVVQHRARGVEAHGLVVEHGAQELGRIVGLEPGRGIADDGEAHRVALVEPVGGEALQLAEDLARRLFRHAPSDGAADEGLADLGHLLPAAVAGHGPAQRVGVGQVETGHGLGDAEHLFLVEDHPVGVGHRLGHGGMGEADRLHAPAAVDEGPDHLGLQRSGPVEGDGGDDVVEVPLFEAGGEVALSGRFELEQPDGAPVGDDLVGGGVVGGQVVGADAPPGAPADEVDALGDGRVRAQAEDIHLDQAQGGDVVFVELGDHHPFGRPLQRGVVGDGPVRDDEASQVGAQVQREGVETLHQVEEAGVAGPVLQRRVAQFRPSAGQVLPDAGRVAVAGHVTGEGVDLVGGEAQGFGHYTDG